MRIIEEEKERRLLPGHRSNSRHCLCRTTACGSGSKFRCRPVSDIEAFTVNVPDLGRSGPVRLVEPSDP